MPIKAFQNQGRVPLIFFPLQVKAWKLPLQNNPWGFSRKKRNNPLFILTVT
jgi:hypothetical protein